MGKGQELTLNGWQGGTFGLRVDAESRRRVFLPLKGVLRQVQVVLPGHGVQLCCRLTPNFWTTCSEFRSAEGAVTVTGWCQLRVASSFLL